MTSSLIYTVLPVGQGTGTLVEVIDDTTKDPKAVIIIDLGATGSTGWSGAQTGEISAFIVAERLLLMDTSTIDVLFLSHPDEDHINMIPELLSHFDKPGTEEPDKPLIIKKVYYAGLRELFTVDGKNILTQLAKYGTDDEPTIIEEAALNAGNIDFNDVNATVYNDNGLKIYLMAGNTVAVKSKGNPLTKKARKDDGYVKNTDSLVLLLSYGSATKRYFVATADATGLTMAACLTRLNKPLAPRLAPILSMSLPHHGSAVTTYDLLGREDPGKDEEKTAQAVITEFVNALKPQSVTVSSGENTIYKLPSPRVIADFAKHVKEATNGPVQDPLIWSDTLVTPGHFYTAYYPVAKYPVNVAADAPKAKYSTYWPSAWTWWPARTTQAVYTVDYFTATPFRVTEKTAETDDDRRDRLIPLVQEDAANLVNPIEAKFTSKNGPFDKVAWIHSWAYTVSEDGTAITFGHRPDDSVNFVDNPDSPPLPPESTPPVLAPAVVRSAAQPRGAARVYRPGRRRVRLLP